MARTGVTVGSLSYDDDDDDDDDDDSNDDGNKNVIKAIGVLP